MHPYVTLHSCSISLLLLLLLLLFFFFFFFFFFFRHWGRARQMCARAPGAAGAFLSSACLCPALPSDESASSPRHTPPLLLLFLLISSCSSFSFFFPRPSPFPRRQEHAKLQVHVLRDPTPPTITCPPDVSTPALHNSAGAIVRSVASTILTNNMMSTKLSLMRLFFSSPNAATHIDRSWSHPVAQDNMDTSATLQVHDLFLWLL